MRRTCAGVVLFLWLMAAWFCQAAEDQHVVLITIDGFPARMFWDAKTPIPRLRQLAADGVAAEGLRISNPTDRKSTRLNSSHLVISYAVFCLKKKKTKT